MSRKHRKNTPNHEGSGEIATENRLAEVPAKAGITQENAMERRVTEEPQETAPAPVPETVTGRFFDAVREVTDELKECASAIEVAEKRQEALKKQLQDAIMNLQTQFGGLNPEMPKTVRKYVKKAAKRGRPRTGKSVRQIILDLFESQSEVAVKDIKKVLADQGRNTNPGVQLSRMVKDKAIVPKERGVYALKK